MSRKSTLCSLSPQTSYLSILHGFVEHFEVELQGTEQSDSPGGMDTQTGVQRAIQLQILKLLSACIDMPTPNIAHLLLGFQGENGKHVSETTLQDPGKPHPICHTHVAEALIWDMYPGFLWLL